MNVPMVRCAAAFGAAALLLAARPGRAASEDEMAAAARKTAQAANGAIVTLQAVARISYSSPDGDSSKEEQRFESYGFVVNPEGLVVTCLSTIDPTAMARGLMEADGLNIQAQITDLKIRLADGTEIPGKVVLRDRDQDLAFIRPSKKPDQPLESVNLSNAASPELLDSVLIVSRLPKVLNRGLSARIERITGVLERPRKRYALNPASISSNDLGSPVLTPAGAAVGILVTRMQKGSAEDSARAMSQNIALVIVPASDILTSAAQAPMEAPPEPSIEEPAKPAAPAVKPAEKPAAKPAAKAPAKPATKPAPKK